MIALDTHVWLWWIAGDPLPRRARRAIEADHAPAVAAISVWETATLVRLGRIRLTPDLPTRLARAARAGTPSTRTASARSSSTSGSSRS